MIKKDEIDEIMALAKECISVEIDFSDISPNQGSTSCNKLVRKYIEACKPEAVIQMLSELNELKQRNLRFAFATLAMASEEEVLTRRDEIREAIKPYESQLDEIVTDGFSLTDEILSALKGQ